VKLDDSKLRDTFRAIYDGALGGADAAAIVDVARFAASVDGRMDMGEMATVARLSKLVYAMSGESDAPVPSTPMTAASLGEIGNRLSAPGPRELAYAAARLVILVDRKVTKEETDLVVRLIQALRVAPARAQEVDRVIETLVREADVKR
jgi:hypothetical protein